MSRHKMSHRKKKRAVLTALVLVAAAAVLVAAGILIGRALTYQEPVPIGTPNQNPVVDQRPVSSSSQKRAGKNPRLRRRRCRNLRLRRPQRPLSRPLPRRSPERTPKGRSASGARSRT